MTTVKSTATLDKPQTHNDSIIRKTNVFKEGEQNDHPRAAAPCAQQDQRWSLINHLGARQNVHSIYNNSQIKAAQGGFYMELFLPAAEHMWSLD